VFSNGVPRLGLRRGGVWGGGRGGVLFFFTPPPPPPPPGALPYTESPFLFALPCTLIYFKF